MLNQEVGNVVPNEGEANVSADSETANREASNESETRARIAELVEQLKHRNSNDDCGAIETLVSIGGIDVIEAATALLAAENVLTRTAACEILCRIGSDSVVPLERLLEDQNKDVRKFAVDTLALIGNQSSENALMEALADHDINVASAAAEALGDIKSDHCVDKLIGAMNLNVLMQCSVAKSLGQIGGEAAVEALIRLTKERNPMVVFSAVNSLSKLQCDASSAVLEELTQHDNDVVAQYASDALRKADASV
ncbi:HEAT repeat domain-containing protein [Rhodopirellula sp. MGV]|uniref:HEAT repeat domain-containing protein n=1 Tax=Rhodopirellula sp. MGV TaxID=2023130 RepID=UPI0013041497|nr:HEAT repeat domain-containing protein [Rhodopirellula sp. MGV]